MISSSSELDFIDKLITILKDASTTLRVPLLIQELDEYAESRESEIEAISLPEQQGLLDSVEQLQKIQEEIATLSRDILEISQSIQSSTEKAAEKMQRLVDVSGVRRNTRDASNALRGSLEILYAANYAYDLIRSKKKYLAALRSLEDLQKDHLIPSIQSKYGPHQQLASAVQKSIATCQRAISEATMADLNTWLFRIRETSQFLGEVAFRQTELRRIRQRKRSEENQLMTNFKLNSAIELVLDETEQFDILDNEELHIDFTPLFECMHVHETLGQSDKFRTEYSATRQQQKDLFFPASVNLTDADDESSLSSLLEGIAGFAIIEMATVHRAPQLRSTVDVGSPRA